MREPVFFLRQMDARSLRSRGATMIDAVPIVGGVGFPQSGTAYLLDPKKKLKLLRLQNGPMDITLMHSEMFYWYDLSSSYSVR